MRGYKFAGLAQRGSAGLSSLARAQGLYTAPRRYEYPLFEVSLGYLPATLHGGSTLLSRCENARCGAGKTHLVPDAHCECGFYATKTKRGLYRACRGLRPVFCYAMCTVELSGIVQEHARGWRAQTQEIIAASYSFTCQLCQEPSVVLAWLEVELSYMVDNGRDLLVLVPFCKAHGARVESFGGSVYTPSELSARSGVAIDLFDTSRWRRRDAVLAGRRMRTLQAAGPLG